MRTVDFEFQLPPGLIAQHPAQTRDQSRLMLLDRRTGSIAHRMFPDLLEYLRPGDFLVANNSRVIPARLHGLKAGTGGKVELLLLEENATNDWWAMVRPAKRVRPGGHIRLLDRSGSRSPIEVELGERNPAGHFRVWFLGSPNIKKDLEWLGEVPLPPYIQRPGGSTAIDWERYQTVYADPAGSVAAPTAGLHFTRDLLEAIKEKGIQIGHVTLHVGPGTFAPVKAGNLAEHRMHEERFELSDETAEKIEATKRSGGRIIAVGTTTVRVLESVARNEAGTLKGTVGRTSIFIYPPFDFKVVDALITNFHLPQSTLLMLVSAFATPGKTEGRESILSAYQEAVRHQYRFFSYGDAMLIL